MTAKKHVHKKKGKQEHKTTAQEQFVIDLYPAARKVADQTGMSWELLLAQTAEETGWGHKVLSGTNNLYNIKALGDGWKGQKKMFKVPEFDRKKKKYVMEDQPFRVYGSYEDSLNDRVAFLRDNTGYVAQGLFKEGTKGNFDKELQAIAKAGYATDPDYVKKITGVFQGPSMQRAIKEAQAREAAQKGAAAAPPQPASSP
jgi:flagellum-specific peptidoglycan hydrolase FlgJ